MLSNDSVGCAGVCVCMCVCGSAVSSYSFINLCMKEEKTFKRTLQTSLSPEGECGAQVHVHLWSTPYQNKGS